MQMQILSKYSPEECLNILKINVDTLHWHWFSALAKPNAFRISGLFGPKRFCLKRRRTYPSFFTALLVADIIEEEKGCRLNISTRLGLTAQIVFGFFLLILAGFLLLDLPLPAPYKKSFFVYVALIGTGLYYVGRQTIRPDERFLCRFLAELFQDDHVLFT
ncbi:hypothetical protein JXQ70_19030 [bacterium]|nr:hypothetical protein [bacterium]